MDGRIYQHMELFQGYNVKTDDSRTGSLSNNWPKLEFEVKGLQDDNLKE